MKALFLLLCPLLLGLHADVRNPPPASDQVTMQATVLSLTEDTALVEAQRGEYIRPGDQFTFPVGQLPAIGVGVGDVVRLHYTGFIQETWPGQIEVTSWQILSPASSPPSRTGQSPPDLTVAYAGQTSSLSYSSATWTYKEEDGNRVTICACGVSPLDAKSTPPTLTRTSNEWVQLIFSARPDSVTIRCWPASLAGQTDVEQQAVSLHWDGNGFTLPKGVDGLIVELMVNWEETDSAGAYGSASYVFSLSPLA